jgi:hypothetical protein
MFRLLRPSRAIAGTVLAAMLAACSGGAHAPSSLPVVSGGGSSAVPAGFISAKFTLTVPGAAAATSASTRKPAYVSSATKSIQFSLVSSSTLTSAQVTAYDARPWGTFNLTTTPPNATCVANGANFTCTLAVALPPGFDAITVTLYDATNATGNVLSEQAQTLSLTTGSANAFSITFDANAATLSVNGSGSCQSGAVGVAFASSGTTAVTFSAAYTDPDSKTVVGPGLPSLAILGNDAAYHTDAGTINGSGGTVGFTINQAAQTFTLTPSNVSVTNAPVSLKATPANSAGSSDGLSFSLAKNFAFSTGPAAPAHNFLAAIEQTGTSTGKIDLFRMTVTAGGSNDTFTAFSPAFLPVTNSSNENKPDVDNPESVAWDSSGDLLIGNGDDGGVNHGNIACVPTGAIASGANTATTVSSYVSSPVGLAYDSREPSIAIANEQPGATYDLVEYLLTGNYTAAPTSRDLKVNTANVGGTSVANLSNLTNGTFAIALTDGSETDTAHNGSTIHLSEIALVGPSGTSSTISQTTTPTTFAVDDPQSLAFDAANGQLVIANASTFHRNLSFYSISAGPSATQTNVINTTHRNYLVAASPDGHIAVAWTTPLGYEQVQVYDNTAARNPVGGPIPYNGTHTSCGTDYIYGQDTVAARSLTWLSNSKLLVAVEAGDTSVNKNGLFIYDITRLTTPAGYDDGSCAAFAAAPTQSAFQSIQNVPLGTAYEP